MSLRRKCLAILLPIVSLAALPVLAQNHTADLGTAFARAQHLRHGINASEWFSQQRNYPPGRLDSYTDARDISLMAKMGFDHVRLSIDPVPLEAAMHGWGSEQKDFLPRLDRTVDTMLANGLAVIIDIHPSDDYKQQMRASNEAVDRLASLWRWLGAHYAGRDPDRVFFEILNEPEVYDPYRWEGIQQRLAAAIREAAPRNTMIATGANYSNVPDLLRMHPLADGNVIYNFHFYEPHEFTHQGATWGTPWWAFTHSIPYPASVASMQDALPQVPDPADRFDLERYFLDHWDAQHIRAWIDAAASWAKRNHVPITCNEFGVYRDHSDPASRAAWIHDVRSALEADGIGWTMWDYRGGFGVVHKQDGQPAEVDGAILDALGLKEKK